MATLSHPTHLNLYRAARNRRLLKRFAAAIFFALTLATIAYGESWLLEDAPRGTLECAVTMGVAHALETPVATN
ncbi:MAG TPA: hypothetical protein VGL25_06605 [Casimicrobiaceae bacterium]|jgi:hypothetical protein